MSKAMKWMRGLGLGLVSVLLLVFIAFEVTAVVFIVNYSKAPTVTFRGNETDLSLAQFKSSRYLECANAAPKNQVDCNLLTKLPKRGWYLQQKSFTITNPYGYNAEPRVVELEWCDTIASCFSNFTVIPSVPKESALAQVRLPRLVAINLTMILLLSSVLLMFYDSRNEDPESDYNLASDDYDSDYGDSQEVFLHRPEICHGQKSLSKLIFWGGNLWTIASLGFWWFSYANERALVSAVGFFGTWQLANATHLHPLKCLLHSWVGHHSVGRRVIQGILYAMAASQCIATYAMIKSSGESSYPRYTCLEPTVQPTNTCSTRELCSTEHLFADPGYGLHGDLLSTFNGFAAIAWSVTGCRLLLWIYMFFSSDMTEDESKSRWWQVFPLLMGLLCLMVSGIMDVVESTKSIIAMNHGMKEATVAFDMACGAVHIALSPWKQYLNVEIDGGVTGQAMRIAKLFLNA
ncbi:hypothetical protein LY76DRAFT_588652 [Colletotrichum caudatum]|nr:hypothetical protein LY76DRAFT_588652 [Colletotrichum caudatum]